MMSWCPKCKYRAVRGFHLNRCPQCGRIMGDGEALTTDPYKPSRTGTRREKEEPKKFVFDQKVSNIKSFPTETLNFFAQDK